MRRSVERSGFDKEKMVIHEMGHIVEMSSGHLSIKKFMHDLAGCRRSKHINNRDSNVMSNWQLIRSNEAQKA